MKKTLLILFAFITAHTTLQGQRKADLRVKFVSPANNSQISSQKSFELKAIVYNMDTAHIAMDDTIRLYLLVGNDTMFMNGGNGITNHLNLYNRAMNPGDSMIFTNTMAFDKSYDNLTISLCVYAKPYNLSKPIVDPQLSNNKGCATITVKKNTEIQSIGKKASTVRVYPNPASNYLNISSQEIIRSICLTDAEGRRTNMEIPVSGPVDCSVMASGIYVVSVTTDSGIYTTRISIQK
jgi:hypothetical protein